MNKILTNKDYISILKYYNINIPRSKRLLKKYAENIMTEKLCKCIKKLEPKFKSKAIGICTSTIFNRKGFTRQTFKCKKKKFVNFSKINTRKNKK
jgi:hypothetical protein